MRLLTHEQASELLFAAGVVPMHEADAADLALIEYLHHHGDPARFADELATEYARHPESAAAHMAACLAITPASVEIPDWPERDRDGALYTGLGDDDADY